MSGEGATRGIRELSEIGNGNQSECKELAHAKEPVPAG